MWPGHRKAGRLSVLIRQIAELWYLYLAETVSVETALRCVQLQVVCLPPPGWTVVLRVLGSLSVL